MPDLVGEAGETLADRVGADQLLDVVARRGGSQRRALRDQLGGRRARGLDAHLVGGQFGLLAREEELHRALRTDRPEPGALGPGGMDQGHRAEPAEGGAGVRVGQAGAGGDVGDHVPRAGEHGPVDAFGVDVQAQDLQHGLPFRRDGDADVC
ncbi:hypothetical protein [Kitasatospora sp. NPDC056531]|uniref:hypothetical protein n=1 Tax=Kitasatospora sp. NPDC056531 TaxID=3345856 RepID=UPI0036B448F2